MAKQVTSRIISCILLALALPAMAAGSATEGRAVFEDQCSDCHTVTNGKNKRGPTLAGVIGRKVGSVPYYKYSDAMANGAFSWTPERLARYLAAPKTDLPGSKMRLLSTPSAQEIADIVEWLKAQR